MAEESFGWLFVDNVPLLCDKRNVARQTQVETWLDLAQLIRELSIEERNKTLRTNRRADYIV